MLENSSSSLLLSLQLRFQIRRGVLFLGPFRNTRRLSCLLHTWCVDNRLRLALHGGLVQAGLAGLAVLASFGWGGLCLDCSPSGCLQLLL